MNCPVPVHKIYQLIFGLSLLQCYSWHHCAHERLRVADTELMHRPETDMPQKA